MNIGEEFINMMGSERPEVGKTKKSDHRRDADHKGEKKKRFGKRILPIPFFREEKTVKEPSQKIKEKQNQSSGGMGGSFENPKEIGEEIDKGKKENKKQSSPSGTESGQNKRNQKDREKDELKRPDLGDILKIEKEKPHSVNNTQEQKPYSFSDGVLLFDVKILLNFSILFKFSLKIACLINFLGWVLSRDVFD